MTKSHFCFQLGLLLLKIARLTLALCGLILWMDFMSTREEVLCVFRGADSEWEAICLDFDIAVHGESLSQVRDLLIYAVNSYIDDASQEDEASKSRLLSRRVPMLVKLRWALEFLFHSVTNRRPETEGRFVLPCHA